MASEGDEEPTCARSSVTFGAMSAARYERIGRQYAATRKEDPQLRDRIFAALGDCGTIVNVGAGAGSCESRDRHVVAIEPSGVMAAQRPLDLAPAIRGSAAPSRWAMPASMPPWPSSPFTTGTINWRPACVSFAG